MSVEHLAATLHHSQATGTVKLILLGIANHAGDGGSWPSLRTLSVYAHVDVRTVRRALARLEELGEIARHVQAGGLAHVHPYERPNLYEVLVTCPEGCEGGPNHRARKGYRRLSDGTYEVLEPVENPPSDPRTRMSGGGETVRGGEDASVPLTIPSTVAKSGSASTTDRARPSVVDKVDPVEATLAVHDAGLGRLDADPCRTCGAGDELTCLRRQLKLATPDRHAYDNGRSPAAGDPPQAMAQRRTEEEGASRGR